METDGGKRSAGGLKQEHVLSHDGIKRRSIFKTHVLCNNLILGALNCFSIFN